jgi:hypothetical protein
MGPCPQNSFLEVVSMKLSEAIRLNGMTKPQGVGGASLSSLSAPCAIGGALQSIGRQLTDGFVQDNYSRFKKAWSWTKRDGRCPACSSPQPIFAVIYHLNDIHRWNREQIAAWVETVEPQDEQADGGPGPGVAALKETAV